MAEIRIDRQALKNIVANLRSGAENEWCVACGAGAASAKLDYPADLIQKYAQQLLDPKSLREFVSNVKTLGGEEAWCVACGAGAAASPLSKVLPAEISDAEIESLAQQLVGAVKVG